MAAMWQPILSATDRSAEIPDPPSFPIGIIILQCTPYLVAHHGDEHFAAMIRGPKYRTRITAKSVSLVFRLPG